MATALKGLASLKKQTASTVMGIDCSTFALAFAIIKDDQPYKWGRVDFEGADVFERLLDARRKVRALTEIKFMKVDYIAFESAILAKVANADVTIKLAMMYGNCIAELMNDGTKITTPRPLEWQCYIGNNNFTKAEKEALKAEVPGKSASWYSNEIRTRRKGRTMDFFNEKWDLGITDDNVGDAFGLAYFGYNKLTTR